MLNQQPVRCFFSRQECEAWVRVAYPKCPDGLRIIRLRNGYWEDTPPKDVTAKVYDLA
jgi:hypothetical protein